MAPTTVLPTLTAMHQSRHSFGTTAVTNTRLGGAELAPVANSEKASLHNCEVTAQVGDTKDSRNKTHDNEDILGAYPEVYSNSRIGGPEGSGLRSKPSASIGSRGTGWAGKTIHSAQVEPVVPARSFAIGDDPLLRNRMARNNTPSGHPKNPAGPRTGRCVPASGKTARGKEAASA